MASKKSKAIKRLKKQIKKLNARIDKLSKEVKAVNDASEIDNTQNMAKESQKGDAQTVWLGSKFSEEEVEMANEITDEAEEVADILDKNQ